MYSASLSGTDSLRELGQASFITLWGLPSRTDRIETRQKASPACEAGAWTTTAQCSRRGSLQMGSTEVEVGRHLMMRCTLHLPAVSVITCCDSTPDHEHQDWGRRNLQDWLRKCVTRPGPATQGCCLGHCPAEGGPSGLRHCQVHQSPVPLLLSCPADVGAKLRPRPCSTALGQHAGSASVAGNGSHAWPRLLLGREGKRDSTTCQLSPLKYVQLPGLPDNTCATIML